MTRDSFCPPRRSIGIAAACGAAVLALALAEPAAAFRPSAKWLVDQAVLRQLKRNISTLTVEQELTRFDVPDAPRGLTVTQRTWVAAPDGLRMEHELPTGTYVRVLNGQKELVRSPGGNEQIKKARPDVLHAFFTIGAPIERRDAGLRLEQALDAAKIDVDVVSFARFDGKVNYLIGAKPWEIGEKPCAFLDKDTLQLTRVITFTKTKEGDRRLDIQLLGWGSAEGGGWFPKRIERHVDGVLQWSEVTRSVERNEAVDKALFEIKK